MRQRVMFGLLLSFILIVHQVTAQGEVCSAIIQEALDATDENCGAIGRNEVCYGNIQLVAQPQSGIVDFTFEQPGDVVPVGEVQTLTLTSKLDEENQWGIALMQLQANIPNSLPGQNVTFILFGEVEIENRVETNVESVTFDVESQGDINVRSGPSTADERIATLSAGDSVTAIGRNSDGSWLQITLEEDSTGWVSADLVSTDGDIQNLDIIDSDTPPLNPMQAFSFQTGLQGTTCTEAPDSGLLIQTPEGAQAVNFVANEVNITLGSTAYLQAQPSDEMTVSLVEGQATVSAFDVTVVVPAGFRTRIPLDDDGNASGPPSEPEPYDEARISILPFGLLPLEITLAEGTPEPSSGGGGGIPPAGEYEWVTGEVTTSGCEVEGMEGLIAAQFPDGVFRLPGGDTFGIDILYLNAFGRGDARSPGFVLDNPEPGLYTLDYDGADSQSHVDVRVFEDYHMEGFMETLAAGCTVTVAFEITRVGD